VTAQARESAPAGGALAPRPAGRRLPGWWPAAAVGAVAAAGFGLFLICLRGVDLSAMNGLGLLSVLPAGSLAGVTLVALAFILGLALPRAYPAALGAVLAGLVICLDGVTVFVEAEPRFATAYQITGFVEYVSKTGHAAPGLAAYFSWPGFFALVAFVEHAAGTNNLLPVLRVWPVAIDLLCLIPLFLIMRNLRVSWRARWLAGFLFAVGNWVGQDYFSPQAFNYLLYLVFLAILVNWFADPAGRNTPPRSRDSRLARLHRRVFGIVRPGELPVRPATAGQKAFLLALLIAIFAVSTASHQLTPFFMLGAVTALALIRRCTLTGLPVLLGVILVGWVSFAAVAYWSGHMSTIFGAAGDLAANLTSSVGGRITGSSPAHLLALHARLWVAAVIVGLAVLGLLRRRRRGFDDRVLLALLCVPVLALGLQSYGGEIALRIYLFLLPAACVLGACSFFPDPQSARPRWRWLLPVLAACALVLPAGFFLARYGNEAFEQVPAGELTAAQWIYARDARGVRLMWLSPEPATDNTPEMPWSYQDLSKVAYLPELAPRDPARVAGLVSALRNSGPGSYLIATRTQVAALQQTASYPAGWGRRFNALMRAAPGVRVAFADSSAVIYTERWPAGTPRRPLSAATRAGRPASGRTAAELALFWLLLAVLAVREFTRLARPSARLIRALTLTSLPLLAALLAAVMLRFAGLA
jgi:hypothetical protein